MSECSVIVSRNVFAKLPSYNPFVGTFHHAPSAGNRGAVYFSGDIVGMSELEERKKFRHHPLTGTFHSLPGYYDPLHRLAEFRNIEDEDTSETDSMRSFVAVDITDGEDMDSNAVMGQPKSLSRMYSDSNCLHGVENHNRPRRFSDSDADPFFIGGQANNNAKEISSNQIIELTVDVVPSTYLSQHQSSLTAKGLAKLEISDNNNGTFNEDALYRASISSSSSAKKRKSSTGHPNSPDSGGQSPGMKKSVSTSDLSHGFISTGKGIFRKIGYRSSYHDRTEKEKSKPVSPVRGQTYHWSYESEYDDDCNEYTQAAPRIPLNPFVARRLNDGEEIRIMAIHRSSTRRDSIPHVINPGSENDDDYSHPKPYFIHERAVTEQYELCGEDQLGDGSYAVVKPAIRRVNGKEVAIKQIHKRYLRTEEAKAAVSREIEIHLRLRHKHIVRLHEVYETPDFLYLVMAKATKGNLKSLMERKRRLPEALAAKLAQQIVRAVFFLHDTGVLHCDLKPENILLSDAKNSNQDSNDSHSPTRRGSASSVDPHADVKVCDLQVELCDFGLSVKVPDVRFYKLTGDVHKVPFTGVTGTPGYIAPELLQQQPYGKPVDMWSVGVVIYEMLTGFQPFYPPHACIEENADFNERVWCKFSAEAKDLAMRLLERDPSKRLTAAEALSHNWFDTATFAI